LKGGVEKSLRNLISKASSEQVASYTALPSDLRLTVESNDNQDFKKRFELEINRKF